MIACSEAVRQLCEYLEGAVEGLDGERVREHLKLCRKCCGEVEFIGELRRFLKQGADIHVPEDVHARLVAAWRRWMRGHDPRSDAHEESQGTGETYRSTSHPRPRRPRRRRPASGRDCSLSAPSIWGQHIQFEWVPRWSRSPTRSLSS